MIEIEFKKVHCKKSTAAEWGRDEIYLVAFPSIVTGEGLIEMQGVLSSIQGAVDKGVVYKPGMPVIQIAKSLDDVHELFLPVALYEADQQAHYRKLQADPRFANAAPEQSWQDVATEVAGVIAAAQVKAWPLVLLASYRVILGAVRAIGQDDLIDLRPIRIDVRSEHDSSILTPWGYREYTFSGLGAEYIVGFEVRQV